MKIIDCHTHLDFDEFNHDRNITIQRALAAGISNIIVSSTTANRWNIIKTLCDDNNKVCQPAYGLHPMFMDQHIFDKHNSVHNDIDKLESWLNTNNAIAIGEIGLDFFIQEADEHHRNTQIKLFIAQLEIATKFKLPVIIHARKSLDIILKHIRRFPTLRGSIHSFSGSEQQAKQLIDLGFYLSFGGPITYSRATKLHRLIQKLPLDAMLVETDSPDQPDSVHFMQRNEPAFIHQVIDKIAEIKKMDIEYIAERTSYNANHLFNLGSY